VCVSVSGRMSASVGVVECEECVSVSVSVGASASECECKRERGSGSVRV